MLPEKIKRAEVIYLIAAGFFIASLITSNLIFKKFFSWDFLGIYTFEISVGLIAYPATFLITDIISEIYGRKRANMIVLAGLFASIFTLIIVSVAGFVKATPWSPLTDRQFDNTFGLTFISVGSSMVAYLLAQLIDVQLFHFWKRVTKGKHLWFRNNASTFTSQFIDTAVVLALLMTFGAIEWKRFGDLLINGFLFKVLAALIDTPIIYFIVWRMRKYFRLENYGEELKLAY